MSLRLMNQVIKYLKRKEEEKKKRKEKKRKERKGKEEEIYFDELDDGIQK